MISDKAATRKKRLTLSQYVRRRNGVPLGHSDSLRNMLRKSLGARSFAVFWQYWNPIWGYGLGKYVYWPLSRFLPPAVALILTFMVSGGIHDLVIMAIRGSIAFVLTPWFLLLGVGVVIGEWANMDVSHFSWPVRALINLAYLGGCFWLTTIIKNFV